MDERQFDALARRWGSAPSRRAVVRAAAGAVVGGVCAALGARRAAACGQVGAECERDRDCCDGAQCQERNCRCREGLANCDGRCRDLARDDGDCGRCGNRCRDEEVCQSGRCLDREQAARERCLGACALGCKGQGQDCFNRCLISCRRA